MAEIEDSEVQSLEFHNAEESLEDKDSEVFDAILLNDSVEATESKLKIVQQQGIDSHGVFSSYFFYFSIEQTPSFPKFIEWCVNNYSPSEGFVMDTSKANMLCPVTFLIVRDALLIPSEFAQMSIEYKEEDIL